MQRVKVATLELEHFPNLPAGFQEWLLVVEGRPTLRPDDIVVRRSSGVDYWDGESRRRSQSTEDR